MTMPPIPLEYLGRELVARFLRAAIFRSGTTCRPAPTRANGQPALVMYLPDQQSGTARATGMLVFTLSGSRVSAITRFDDTVLPRFGVPRTRRASRGPIAADSSAEAAAGTRPLCSPASPAVPKVRSQSDGLQPRLTSIRSACASRSCPHGFVVRRPRYPMSSSSQDRSQWSWRDGFTELGFAVLRSNSEVSRLLGIQRQTKCQPPQIQPVTARRFQTPQTDDLRQPDLTGRHATKPACMATGLGVTQARTFCVRSGTRLLMGR